MSNKYAIAPNGQAVLLTDEQAAATSGEAGFTPITEGDYKGQRQAQVASDYVDQNWGTSGKAAAGLASGLTLGLAPSLASRMGLVDKDHLEAAEQSGAYMAGDVAGMVAPSLLTGGGSLAARGAAQGGLRGASKLALALTPAGLMGEAGGLAERFTAKMLGEAGIMGKLANPTISMAARGATEGAINNMAHTVSDQVIQNKPLAAEAILASGVDGALFGGLTGGVLGGASAAAGAGIDLVGGRVASAGAGRAGAGAKVMKYLGSSREDVAAVAGRESGILNKAAGAERSGVDQMVHGLQDILQKGDGSVSAGVQDVRRASKVAYEGYSAGLKDDVSTMTRDAAASTPTVARLNARMNTELGAKFNGTSDAMEVTTLNRQIQKQFRSIKTWEGWAKSRESLATKLEGMGEGVHKDVLKTTLNIIDDEMVGDASALMASHPELAKSYAANVVGKGFASDYIKMTAVEAANPATSSFNVGQAVGVASWSGVMGVHPVIPLGMMAGKQILDKVKQGLAAPMAEAAFRSALGAQANHATVNMGQRMTRGVRGFLRSGTAVARGEHAESNASKPSYTIASYQKSLQLADELTSASHQAKVRETTEALAQQGHPEMAQAMAETYGRAVAFVNQNKPKKGLDAHGAGKLGKVPEAMGLDTKDMKFIRQIHALTMPMDAIMGGLGRGDISRDAVATFQNVFPAAAADLNMRVAQEVVEYRNEGKFVPADKIALLGTVLNFPVDSTLEPAFVDEVQKGLAANKAPPPDQNASPPPQTDTSSYQTPMQQAMT